jgi:hypothetical protein
MIHDGGAWRAYADSPSGLLDYLAPGYTAIEESQQRMVVRIRLAVRAQVTIQAAIIAARPGELRRCTEEQTAVLLADRSTPPTPPQWTAPIPLVLITSFYEPVGDYPRPSGPERALIWLDPATEWSLLASLHAAGVIDVGTSGGESRPGQ